MGHGKVGRPRSSGERYPSGKLKPTPVADFERKPMTGAMWQRLVTDGLNVFGDQRFATELTRLGAIGELSPAEVATGIRIAGIYGRYEYYQGVKRTTASPYYVRQFIAATPDESYLDRAMADGSAAFDGLTDEDIEEKARQASEEFKDLQSVVHRGQRQALELLCVDNRHVSYMDLLSAKDALAALRDLFKQIDEGTKKKLSYKERQKLRAKRKQKRVADPAPAPRSNPLKQAFFAMQRRRTPDIEDAELEAEWLMFCAIKDRSAFQLEKSGGGST